MIFRDRRSLRFFCDVAGVVILLAGLLIAGLIYHRAGNLPDEGLSYEFVDGAVYVVDPGDSKLYRRELERFGGKAAIFADDLNRWFSSLWKGRRLAFIVALFSIVIAFGIVRFGRAPDLPPPDQPSDR
ncbi:hypothetical protein SAMN05660652_00612 [Propionivibrio dicarboxylicus]|uniref:Uncharacterized protein n=1 Tax=Propionivibrio dicarboxylicus TaxID=83767 RepID=A0A1G7WRB7_9RHOO|nr:hypothetical protein SAMN05660652_00612 [Propionivibrio dicarboxylicus]